MTPEERELLTRSIKLAEENNKMLHSMRRNARFASFLRIVYWLVILGTAFGAYYFVQPFLAPIFNTYSDIQKGISNVKNVSTALPSLPSWLRGE